MSKKSTNGHAAQVAAPISPLVTGEWNWCRYCQEAWRHAERLDIHVFVERYGLSAELPVRDCPKDHGYSSHKQIPVVFCADCRQQLALLPPLAGGYMVPPHTATVDGVTTACKGSNALVPQPHMWRDAETFARESEQPNAS